MTLARVNQFLRSLLPSDLFQACFLASLVSFTIAPHLRWWPTFLSRAYDAFRAMPIAVNAWTAALVLVLHGLYLAASAGYFFCLWPTRRGTLWMGLLVVLPAVLALALVQPSRAGLQLR